MANRTLWVPLLCSFLLPIRAANWPQWRGPGSSGVSPETGLPIEWNETKNIIWKTAIPGRGHSSPIVWGKKIFVTTAIEGSAAPGAKAVRHLTADGQEFLHPDAIGADHFHTFKVVCLALDTGEILWQRTAWQGTPYDARHRKNSYATPTPVTDGHYVYVFFGAEGLYCYDFNGTLIWKSTLGPIATMGMGVASSPVLYQDLILLQCDQDNGQHSFAAAVNKQTGQQVWKVRRTAIESWSSPILARTRSRDEFIVNAREIVISYDPATGKEFWRCAGAGVNPAPSPVVGHDMVFITAGAAEKRAIAIRLGGSGDVTNTSQVAWRYSKGTAHVPSPILYGDYIYLMTDNGIFTCLDARSGQVKYQGKRLPASATFTSSPVAFDGSILVSSEDGDTYVLKAGPEYQLLRANSIGEPIYASPAIADGKILIRGEKSLYCAGQKGRR
jgi:outer membrane protein assembly factor BamB